MHLYFHTFFVEVLGWPGGIIVGNLMASVVWSAVFEWRLRIHRKAVKKDMAAHHDSIVDNVSIRIRDLFDGNDNDH